MENEYPTVIPMIAYENGVAAIDWLSKAFGFRERIEERYVGEDGSLGHAEMEAGDGLIMLATPTPDYESPKHHRETCEQARKWSVVPWVIDGVLVYVDDLEAHFERAKAAGATFSPGSKKARLDGVTGLKIWKGIAGSSSSETEDR